MKKYLFILVVKFLFVSIIEAQITITLSAKDKGRVFEGIGAVSAGAYIASTYDRNLFCNIHVEPLSPE